MYSISLNHIDEGRQEKLEQDLDCTSHHSLQANLLWISVFVPVFNLLKWWNVLWAEMQKGIFMAVHQFFTDMHSKP